MAGIVVFGDTHDMTLELLTIGKTLAQSMQTTLHAIMQGQVADAGELIGCGADQVLVLPQLSDNKTPADILPGIAAALKEQDADVILMSSTLRGRELAARLASRLNAGLCTECIRMELKPGTDRLRMERLMFGGAAIQEVECIGRPQMATIPPRTYDKAMPEPDRTGDIRELSPAAPSAIRVVEQKPRSREAGDITQSRVIVCAGRGIENQEDMAMLKELADILGAEIAGTRPITEEMHWLPDSHCIGLSGKHVKPELYIGIGISGQVQHVCGIRDAKVICAVNKDENAPIFGAADHGIQGDLYQVLPLLIREFKQILG